MCTRVQATVSTFLPCISKISDCSDNYYHQAAIGDADAESIVVVWPNVVTSPNMTSIPFIPTGNVTMRPLQDGRFGYLDFTLWPQVHNAQFAHRPLVLRRDANEAVDISIMWWTPTEADGFIHCDGVFGRLGRLDKGRLGEIDTARKKVASSVDVLLRSSSAHPDLKYYYSNLCLGISRLTHNPYTLCDLILDVAQTQRHYHDTAAYLRYVNEGWAQSLHGAHDEIRGVDQSLMGCWTADITVVQRYRRGGVPIYYLRPEQEVNSDMNIVRAPAPFTRSDLVVNVDWCCDGRPSPFPTVYSGPQSVHVHAAASQQIKLIGLTNYQLKVDLSQESRDVIPVGFSHYNNKSNARSNKRSRKGKNPSTWHIISFQPYLDFLIRSFKPKMIWRLLVCPFRRLAVTNGNRSTGRSPHLP